MGRDCYTDMEGLFLYKNMVQVPPLGMIDDIASFAECNVDSLKTNAIINSKIESKKLEFGQSKCFTIHIGKYPGKCQNLKVHKNTVTSKASEKYLGDIVSSTGNNTENINFKANQDIGAVSQILSMINRVSLGHNYFEIALIMKESMLDSKLLSNSEIWYNVTKDQYTKLERIGEMFMRRFLNVPISVPKEALYIEGGCLPIKYLVKIRRLMYLWGILHSDNQELVVKFFKAQSLSSDKGDWVNQVGKDRKEIDLKMTNDEICKISQEKFRGIVKIKTTNLAIKNLNEIKMKHSKTENLILSTFSLAKYFVSKNLKK